MTAIKSVIYRNFTNAIGKKIKSKVIVFESDDWGSIRMPSQKIYNYLLSKGVHVDKISYEKYDCLESDSDLYNLFETLTKYKDKNGNHPSITANTIMSNPDFEKIKSENFSKYHYEHFFDTYEKYYSNRKLMQQLWNQGMKEHIFIPQFHGLEHYRISDWMASLNKGDNKDRELFDLGIVSLSQIIGKNYGSGYYLRVLNSRTKDETERDCKRLADGLNIFENTFGFKPKTFIAPCYTWSTLHEKILNEKGVSHIQGITKQNVPYSRPKFRYTGMRNSYKQTYLTRNVFFEPASDGCSVNECLQRISNAFMWNQPAIICAHRINFCGMLSEKNRTSNLTQFNNLLNCILKRWPDVEFMSSDQLATLI